jgi:hypothetical protein
MNNEIIQKATYISYDDFQHINFVFSHQKVHYFEDYLMMKLP